MNKPAAEFELSPDVRFRLLDGEGIMVRQDTGEVIVVNEVGAQIVNYIREGRLCSSIPDDIAGEFEVTRDAAETDLDVYLDELESKGVLRRKSPDVENE